MVDRFFVEKFSYIVLLIPLLLITGPFLPDLIVSLSCIFFIYLSLSKKRFFFNNNFVKIFILFYITLIISSIFSENLLPSLKSSFFYFRFGLFIIVLIYFFNNNNKFEKRFIKVGLISILIVILSCLIEFFLLRFDYLSKLLFIINNTADDINFSIQHGALINSVHNRVSGIFGSEGVAGSFLLRISPFFYFYYLINFFKKKQPTIKKIIILNLIFLLIPITVLLTGERASFILVCFSIFLNFIIIKRLRKYLKYSLYASLILVFTIVSFDPIIKSRLIYETKYQLTHFHDLSNKNVTKDKSNKQKIFLVSQVHQGHFIAAWKIFLENKYLGAGLKGFRYKCFKDKNFTSDNLVSCSTHPHNILMQFLSETGILGTLFYVLLLFYVSFQIIKNIFLVNIKKINTSINKDIQNCALICILISIWPLTTSGSFFNNWLSILYYLPIVFYLKDQEFMKNVKSS